MKTNGRLIVLTGKSGSGKSTLLDYIKACGCSAIKIFTTRPKRDNSDNDYEFLNYTEFFDMYSEFVDVSEYDTINGVWHYGFKIPFIGEDKFLILNPRQLPKFKRFNPIVVYLDLPDDTLLDRLAKREDSLESSRRFLADIVDFKHIQHTADIIIKAENKTVEEISEELALRVEEIKSRELIERR